MEKITTLSRCLSNMVIEGKMGQEMLSSFSISSQRTDLGTRVVLA